ncbi:tRNA pseudouridine synthase A [Pseudoloma neurophilia]|uniref:tRNA pseudouridine synthase n=1 Tax=Pseudoloma neurophilia TaxID=146866 RepID=A0A0R0LYT9_9MICR|nr:tRNA pseudouridine synthase A [Pseudoloma neurophilia]
MKRRVAVLLAYIGEPFYGLQYQKWNTTESRASIHKSKEKTQDQEDINTEQPQTSFNTEDLQKIDQTPVEQLPTIEKTLIDFFYEKELLKESNKLPDRCHLRRACRTDKGVSAAFNIVSLCLEKKGNLDDIDLKDVEYFKNTFSSTKTPDIDDFIYFHKLIEVPKSFCPKLYVTHRVYSYLLPKYIFPGITIGFLQQIFNFYKGTHNFHNFTKKNTEKGTKRYIMDILVLDDQDFYDIQIKGQSFMMHQIRKMIGLVALVLWHISDSTFARSNVLSEELKDEKLPSLAPIQDQCMAKKKETINDEPNNEFVTDSTNSKTPCLQSIKAIFDHTLSPQTHNIPKAPSTYLFLRYCDLDLYNRKCKNNKKNTTEIVIDKHQIDEISEIIKKYLKKDKTLFEQWKECIKEHINEYLPFLHG